MITPDEIKKRADGIYRRYLRDWVRGEVGAFKPQRIRADLKLSKYDVVANQKATQLLRKKSKEVRRWGYSVAWKEVNSPTRGRNEEPKKITIDTLDDLLRLTDRAEEFQATRLVVERVRSEFPALSDWLVGNVGSLKKYAADIDGLIAVAKYFLENPKPGIYARQIPVADDTKFVERNQGVLEDWLDVLLPPTEINFDGDNFDQRYGLREKPFHRGLRLLDQELRAELGLPFDELSPPIDAIASWKVRDVAAFIVENDLNLFTMPPLPRALGIHGKGANIPALAQLAWLHDNRLIYWGDIDTAGFEILSDLRRLFWDVNVQSLMMDRATLEAHQDQIGPNRGKNNAEPQNLTEEELRTFRHCRQRNEGLEQEKIRQTYVDEVCKSLFAH